MKRVVNENVEHTKAKQNEQVSIVKKNEHEMEEVAEALGVYCLVLLLSTLEI